MYIHLSIRLRITKGKYVCIYQKSNLVSFRSWTLSSSSKLPEVRVISTLYTTVMMGVRVEWFVSIRTSSNYNGEKKGEWTRRFVPPNERRKLEREICSARWIWHLFISALSTIYDVRHPLLLPPGTRRYACPSSSFRCSRKRPSLLSLACASGRLSFAVGKRYYCVKYATIYPPFSFRLPFQLLPV